MLGGRWCIIFSICFIVLSRLYETSTNLVFKLTKGLRHSFIYKSTYNDVSPLT